MAELRKWRDGVKIVRAASIDGLVQDPAGTGRATGFDFSGNGSDRTW
ncbi:MAG: cupin protein, partial [Herminiimonas sp.]|nr:cupin protein [Herminiimonas sp.]